MAYRTKIIGLIISIYYIIYFVSTQSTTKPLKICSFNIQIFGEAKVNNPTVFNEIIKIVELFDIIFIQEIRDNSNTAIFKLIAALNKVEPNKYSLALSDRLGRTVSKEQYAFIYKTSAVKLVTAYHFDDGDESTHKDIFEREPYIARFSSASAGVKDFFIIGLHATPDKVETGKEIASLIDVYDNARNKFKIEDGIIMGDLNADCSYFNQGSKKTNSLIKDQRFVWLIGDDADTTTKNSHCAYDRVIVAGKNMIAHVGKAEIFDFQKLHKLDMQTATKVSDHYPVIFTIG